ncbi:hypothetical protein D9619_012091 [Psilocybe cf. subviscida]|uniref:Uncharacterized protein n=1 Tax=Psilocybe cf. subviscida TaxID=2480587 RepID=A0A8H5B7V9_9AGAR|nr:hypothetical protein D9619_012091 [Psilocybe cf. subviscida]
MSFSELASELIFEIASRINDDDVTTLLHLAMVNQQLFAIVIPKLIASQSARIQDLTFDNQDFLLIPMRRVFLEPNEITYNNYWFHEDCRNNIFAQSYIRIYLLFHHTLPDFMYTYACALIRRAPNIYRVILDIRYEGPTDCERVSRFLDLCARRSPPPSVDIMGESQPSSNRRERHSGWWYNGPFISPIVNTQQHYEAPYHIVPFPSYTTTTRRQAHPRQPPRVSTKLSCQCICWPPTNPVSAGRNPNLQELKIQSDCMFMPSMYRYTVEFINLTPLTALCFHHVGLLCSAAWSQILYCLQIPTLESFVLNRLTIAFLDVVFFWQRHQTITSLSLHLDLCREDGDGDCILPPHFDLPELQALDASGEYAILFMQHHTAHRFKELRTIAIGTPLLAFRLREIAPTGVFPLYDLLAARYDQLTNIRLCFSLRRYHFIEWALQTVTAANGLDPSRGVFGAVHFGTPQDAATDIPDQTFISMLNWVKDNRDGWPQHADLQMASRSHVFQEFIYALCPRLEVWHEGRKQVDRYNHRRSRRSLHDSESGHCWRTLAV